MLSKGTSDKSPSVSTTAGWSFWKLQRCADSRVVSKGP
jgi:hypothetical protein